MGHPTDYTAAAVEAFDAKNVHIIGQGTWRINEDRIDKGWLWGDQIVSEDVLLVSKEITVKIRTNWETASLLLQPFSDFVWVLVVLSVFGFTLVLLCSTKPRKIVDTDDDDDDDGGPATPSPSRTVSTMSPPIRSPHRSASTVSGRPSKRQRRAMRLTSQVSTTEPAAMDGKGSDADDAADDADDDDERDVTWGHVCYAVFISCVGEHTVEPNTRVLMGIYAGWVFFVFFLAEIYAADLAAILLTPRDLNPPNFADIDECIQQQCRFCVQKGAANALYFTEEAQVNGRYEGLNVVQVGSIDAQINGVLHGVYGGTDQCDVAEVTKEDLYQWAKVNPQHRCRVKQPSSTGSVITKRIRGMLTNKNNACILTVFSALHHKLSVAGGVTQNVDGIYKSHFPTPNYDPTSKNCDARQLTSLANGTSGYVELYLHPDKVVVLKNKGAILPPAAELFPLHVDGSEFDEWFDVQGGYDGSRTAPLTIERVYIIFVILVLVVGGAFLWLFLQRPRANLRAFKMWIKTRLCCCFLAAAAAEDSKGKAAATEESAPTGLFLDRAISHDQLDVR